MLKSLTAAFFIIILNSQIAYCADIEVRVTGIKNDKGQLLVALYNKENKSLNIKKAIKSKVFEITNNDMIIRFNGLKIGEYALGVFHDEDSNGKLNTGVFGIPIEGYGYSNNLSSIFTTPTFDKAKFSLFNYTKKITIRLNY